MVIKNFTIKEFLKEIYDFEYCEYKIKIGDSGSFENFKYFSPGNFASINSSEYFLVAYGSMDEILGVICYGEYGYAEKYLAISFIDVNMNHRHAGIAKALIKNLNNHIGCRPLHLSALSELGKKYHIDSLFKELINSKVIVG